jgi:hypothetical protein
MWHQITIVRIRETRFFVAEREQLNNMLISYLRFNMYFFLLPLIIYGVRFWLHIGIAQSIYRLGYWLGDRGTGVRFRIGAGDFSPQLSDRLWGPSWGCFDGG